MPRCPTPTPEAPTQLLTPLGHLSALLRRPPIGRTAVVVGASLAGLLAARVLAERYDNVLLLDRDALPDGDAHRAATPHTRHAHGLLARGRQALETLFPGIRDEWQAQGATFGDLHHDVAFYAGQRRFAQADAGTDAVALGRAAIEGSVRRRVLALRNVRALTGVAVQGLVLDAERGRVTGLRVAPEGSADAATLPAQLVVDASGRGSALPRWLAQHGLPVPREERVAVALRYVTAYLQFDPAQAPREAVVLCAATPDCPRPAVLIRQEGARWVLTLGGYGADAPPTDRLGFLARARAACPEIARVVQFARFVTEPAAYHFAHSQRRHYEHLKGLPEGLLAIGDAVCSFNPIYGQGMTVAAAQALALQASLAEGLNGVARRYFPRAARVVDGAWDTAVSADLAIPGVQGRRPLPVRLVNAYIARLNRVAQVDPVVAGAFLRVAHLLDAPGAVLRPALLWRVLAPRRGLPAARPVTALRRVSTA